MNRTEKNRTRIATRLTAALAVAGLGVTARADDPLRISEFFFDAPGDDLPQMYIELRGTPGTSLNNKYIAFVESENNSASGDVDAVFNLSGRTIGSNGFLMLLPIGFNRNQQYIRKGTNIVQNTTGFGFGENTIGFTSLGGLGDVENGGFSAFLIDKGAAAAPALGQVLDSDKDSVLDATAPFSGWTIHDSVGQAEPTELDAFSYAKTFFSGNQLANISTLSGSTNVIAKSKMINGGTPEPVEPEYLARYGSSTLTTANGWMMANITNNAASGYNAANFAKNGYVVSADPHGAFNLDHAQFYRGLASAGSFQNVGSAPHGTGGLAMEGTIIQNTLGRPNWPIKDGDLSQNEAIDQADLDIVVNNWHVANASLLGYWLAGDPAGHIETISGVPTDLGGDGVVNKADLDFVMSQWPTRGSVGYTQPNFGSLEGDINLDGVVNLTDLSVIAQHWGQTGLGYGFGDWDYDNYVGITDLYLTMQNWQGGFGPLSAALASVGLSGAIVPEPTGLSLLLAATSTLLARRRRASR